ncbi:hypothetical protein [Nostoc sp.]|uniref:hypothetical protein n=1 Tax=Nostoc sp. TaxID=1180 RepID=UPI002FFA3F3B
MTSTVIGNGPIGFTDKDGNQRFIPLSSLKVEGSEINLVSSQLYTKNKLIVDAVLKNLIDGGFLTPGANPPPKPALVLKAAIPGAAGNTIQVTFSNIVIDRDTPANTTFDATITAKEIYSGLSFDSNSSSSIKKVLGTETIIASSPGLVRAKDTDTPTQPTDKQSYTLAGGGVGKSHVDITGTSPGPTAFTVEAWKVGSEGDNITIKISEVDAIAKTFTLVAEFKPQLIAGIKLADLPGKLAGSDFVITVAKPDNANYAIPARGTVILGGGADAKAASTATAIAATNS